MAGEEENNVKKRRVALCLRGAMDKIKSGHFSREDCDIYRDLPYVPFEAVRVSLQQHLFEANPDCECDVFVHSWNPDLEPKFKVLYEPKLSFYEDNKQHEADIKGNMVRNFAYTSQQMSICRSLRVMQIYAHENDIQYDKVISYRPDALLYKDMRLTKDYADDNVVYVNSDVFEDFHFVMSHADAEVFGRMYGTRLLIPQFVHTVMKKKIVPDNIKCGIDQEILRKLKVCCVDKRYHDVAFFERYGLTAEQIAEFTHV